MFIPLFSNTLGSRIIDNNNLIKMKKTGCIINNTDNDLSVMFTYRDTMYLYFNTFTSRFSVFYSVMSLFLKTIGVKLNGTLNNYCK